MKYSINVYEDQAIISGGITDDVLMILHELAKIEGFTHLTSNPSGEGFRFVNLRKVCECADQ